MNLNRTGRVGALCWLAAAPIFLVASLITGLRWREPDLQLGHPQHQRPRQRPLRRLGHHPPPLRLLTVAPTDEHRDTGHRRTARRRAPADLADPRPRPGGALGPDTPAAGHRRYALAAVYPADVDENLHVLGAFLIMGMGNIGLLLAGCAPHGTALGRWRRLTLTAGLIALAGTVLFFAQQGLGIGVGGMERVAVLPFPLWACCPRRPAEPNPRPPARLRAARPRRSWSCGAGIDQRRAVCHPPQLHDRRARCGWVVSGRRPR